MSLINFESSRELDRRREELKQAKEEAYRKAKKAAEIQEKRRIKQELSGESSWMHPDVLKKLEGESTEHISKHKKSKKDKKSKRSKSEKKTKKKSKSKHKKKMESSSDSDSDSTEDEWVEKPTSNQPSEKLQRDEWMTTSSLFATYSKEKVQNKPSNDRHIDSYDPSKCSRELNPYWKDGGDGLPKFKKPRDDSDEDKPQIRKPQITITKYNNWKKKSTNPSSNQLPPKDRKYSSDSSSNESETEKNIPKEIVQEPQDEFLTDLQMNELGAQLVSAEIMEDHDLVKELKVKLERARIARTDQKQIIRNKIKKEKETMRTPKREDVLLTVSSTTGDYSRPLKHTNNDQYGASSSSKKTKRVDTHSGGERQRYFADDDRFDIKQMFEREKFISGVDNDIEFAKIAGKHKSKMDNLDDIFTDEMRKDKGDAKAEEKERQRAINEHRKMAESLETCHRCLDSKRMEKQLVVAMGKTTYLALPWHEGLQRGHCLLTTRQHATCATSVDEDVWNEITDVRKALTRMYAARKQDVIFFETVKYMHRHPHMVIHCIPGKDFELAPFYFKKAIQESESEWAQNKQLVNLSRDRDVRRSIPKGLPYFWVQFGMDTGFAHVIEDQESFPSTFAQEVIGGLLNLDARVWRKPRKEHHIIEKVKQFVELWKPFDCYN